MPTRLIFIAHGQLPQEKPNGLALARLVNGTDGFRAFFAENVQSTDALSQHILGNLEKCDGFLAVMHQRDTVTYPGGTPHIRASVWIQQELAIVTFINHQREPARRIKIRVFAQRGIKREGLAEFLIVNPTECEQDEELPDRVQEWLKGPDFALDPVATTRQDLFARLTADLREEHWQHLEVIMVMSGDTTHEVDEAHVVHLLRAMNAQEAAQPEVRDHLHTIGFISLGPRNLHTGRHPAQLTPAFVDLITDELRRRGTLLPPAST